MTNAEWPKRYRQRLKEKYLTEELKKKESERRKGKGIANLEEIRKKDRKVTKVQSPQKSRQNFNFTCIHK